VLSRRDRISAAAAGRDQTSHAGTGNSMDGMDELDRMDMDATLVKIGDMATIPCPADNPAIWTRALRAAHYWTLPNYDCPYFSFGAQLLLAKVAWRLHVFVQLVPAQGRRSRPLTLRVANRDW
jgi:hypothetical protein